MSDLQPFQVLEEVVKDGRVIQQYRDTLQLSQEARDIARGNPAVGLVHGNVVPPQDRIYTYNPETGMSTSVPRASEVTIEEEQEEPESEDGEEEEEGDEEEALLCLHPVGNGECQLPPGHEGQHRLNVD